jgi:hypothetical protein
MKHTSIPWEAGEYYTVITSGGTLIADCSNSGLAHEEREANRTLIVEACNNYEKLKSGIKLGIEIGKDYKKLKAQRDALKSLVEKVADRLSYADWIKLGVTKEEAIALCEEKKGEQNEPIQ